MRSKKLFNRTEFSGSLGDIGTLLPIATGMILINQLNPLGVFFSIGLYYLFSGLYFKVPVPVQPMKLIGTYAIAMGLSSQQVLASGLIMAVILFLLGITNLVTVIGQYIPKSVVRGVQLSTGVLLLNQGLKLVIGTSQYQKIQQMAEPFLKVSDIGVLAIPIGIVMGITGAALILLLINSKRFPAGLAVVLLGLFTGLCFGRYKGFESFTPGLFLPDILGFEFPARVDFVFAMFALVLPQLPMTIGNAVIAYVDLSKDYFAERSGRVTYRSAILSMSFANVLSFLLGGVPLCHGSGGLAAHYRFGARNLSSNIIIGGIFTSLALFFGSSLLGIVYLIPMAVLGVLLIFAGAQLAITVYDLKTKNEYFIVIIMLGVTLVANLSVGFAVGVILTLIFKWSRISI